MISSGPKQPTYLGTLSLAFLYSGLNSYPLSADEDYVIELKQNSIKYFCLFATVILVPLNSAPIVFFIFHFLLTCF